MKKAILLILIGFIVGALVSPAAGMALTSTRNLILGMAPDDAILALADKIDQESGKNEEQEQKINEQSEAINNLKREQETASCQKKKEDCEKKLYELDNGELKLKLRTREGDRAAMIEDLEDLASGWEKNAAFAKENGDEKSFERLKKDIASAKEDIATVKETMASEQIQKEELLNGECKDYQNPCE